MIAALLLAACIPLPDCVDPPIEECASPTPVIQFDNIAEENLKGYTLYGRVPGGAFQLLDTWECEWIDENEDGDSDIRICRGSDFGAPVQRYCPWCEPLNEYEFAVKAYNTANVPSDEFSNPVTVCMPQVVEF